MGSTQVERVRGAGARSAVVALIALIAVVVGPGIAAGAAGSDPAVTTPTVSVTPDTGLLGGQQVTVSAAGFTPGQHGRWCVGIETTLPGLHYCAVGTTQTRTVAADGTFGGSSRVDQYVYISATQSWVDCYASYNHCVISTGTTEAPDTGARHALTFGPKPPPPTTRGTISLSSNVVRADHTVTVTGSGFRSGALVDLRQCRPDEPIIWPNWCTAPKVSVTAGADGSFQADITVQRVVAPPAQLSTDCATTPATKPCVISAAEAVDLRYTAVSTHVTVTVGPTTVVPGSASVAEGNTGTKTLLVPVALSDPSDQTVTVPWTTTFVPGAPAGQADPATDYAPASGTVTFAPGQTTASVAISVNGDTAREPDEYAVIAFHDPTHAAMGGFWGLAFAGITNDDPVPQIVPGSATVTEGDAGSTVLHVPVTLSSPSTDTVTATWTTAVVPDAPAGQADPATDYAPASGTVTFAPGETTASVAITVDGDTTPEPDEYLVVAFHSPTNATLGGFWGLGFGGITDDD